MSMAEPGTTPACGLPDRTEEQPAGHGTAERDLDGERLASCGGDDRLNRIVTYR